jgi:hypothetical protein
MQMQMKAPNRRHLLWEKQRIKHFFMCACLADGCVDTIALQFRLSHGVLSYVLALRLRWVPFLLSVVDGRALVYFRNWFKIDDVALLFVLLEMSLGSDDDTRTWLTFV